MRPIGLNTVAFGLVIAVQQLLVFPALSRIVSVVDFSAAVLLVTVSTVVANIVGVEASNVALLRSGLYRSKGIPWDSARIVFAALITLCTAFVIAIQFWTIDVGLAAQFLALTLLGVIRAYGLAPEKSLNRFQYVVFVHASYAVGAIVGIGLVGMAGSPLTPFVTAEVAALLCLSVIRIRFRDVTLTLKRTVEYSGTRRQFLDLAAVAVLMNIVSYLDRLMIVPLLGAAALGVYYAASAVSKSMSMITNPVGNTLLSRLGMMEDASAKRIFPKASRMALGALGVFALISLGVSYVGLKILYPTFFESAVLLLAPVSLSAAFNASSDLMRPVIMRFVSSRKFFALNLIYAAIYAVGVLLFTSLWGIVGFAWAGALASAALFSIFLAQSRLVRGRQ